MTFRKILWTLATVLLFCNPVYAIKIHRDEILRASYLSWVSYFFERLSEPHQSSISPQDQTVLNHLFPPPRTVHEWAFQCDETSVCGVDTLLEKPTTLLAGWTVRNTAAGDRVADITFAVRGTANIQDALADLTLLEIYDQKRFDDCTRYHNLTTKGFIGPCHLDRFRKILPKAHRCNLPGSGLPVHEHNCADQCAGNTLEKRLIQSYLLKLGTTMSEYLNSRWFRKNMDWLHVSRVGRIIFTGDSLGGLLAKILAMNYDNRIGGFAGIQEHLMLPLQAQSIGFSSPGLSTQDYRVFFYLMTNNEPGPDPVPFEPAHHYLIGHKQDLIYALGHVITNRQGQLVHEPEGCSLLLSLAPPWFQRCVEKFPAASKIAAEKSGWNSFTSAVVERLLSMITGVHAKCLRPHNMAALIKNLEKVPGPYLDFHLANGEGTRAIPLENSEH